MKAFVNPRVKASRFLFVALGVGVALSGCQSFLGLRRTDPEIRNASYRTSEGRSLASGPGVGIDSIGQPKKKVVVLRFWNDTPVQSPGLDEFVANELRRGLYLTERVIIPTDLTLESGTRDFVSGDQVRVAQLVREGRRLGVSVLIIGRISRVQFRQRGEDFGLLSQKNSVASVELEAKVFDIQSGKEVMALTRSGESTVNALIGLEGDQLESSSYRLELAQAAAQEALAAMISPIVRSVEKLTWQGRIAKIQGSRVYLSAGRDSGLMSGDILRVMTLGEDIFDPSTGAYLGRSRGQLKGTLEVVEFIGSDAAVADIHSGSNFQEGDLVQLY